MPSLFFTGEVFRATVDYSRSMHDLIASGGFDRIPREFSGVRFEGARLDAKTLQIHLVGLSDGAIMSTTGVRQFLTRSGYRPLRFEELMALAAVLSSGVLRRNAHALASCWRGQDGQMYIPSCSLKQHRRLRLSPIDRNSTWSWVWDCFPCVAVDA